MNWLIRMIDEDVVRTLDGLRRVDMSRGDGSALRGMLAVLYSPPKSVLKVVLPVVASGIPISFLGVHIRTAWAFACSALLVLYFGLYFYRLALMRQRRLDNGGADEFGS